MNSLSQSDLVPPTDLSLIRRVTLGEQEAWARFVRLYSPLIYSKCRAKQLSAEDSAEILQEVFLKVHKSIADFAPSKQKASFRSWLRTVAGNAVIDHFRAIKLRCHQLDSRAVTLQLQDLSHAFLNEELDSANEQYAGETQMLVAEAMNQVRDEFTPKTWQAFWRFTIDDVPAKDIAEELGMSPGAVRQAKLAVKKRLRTVLDGLID